jgi:serine/threonine protein kinase/Leucine-rich repeat (LRR) protein
MPAAQISDLDMLKSLLLGQLSSTEVDRLEAAYSSDDRLAALAEGLSQSDELLRNLRAARPTQLDPESERLIDHLIRRLQIVLPNLLHQETADLRTIDSKSPTVAAAAAAPLPERFEYYRPIRVLGEGGMGTVYLAEDTRLGRQVALKTMKAALAANPLAHQRFLREARTAARLGHDHIVPIYYVGEADGTPFLAMPLLKGESLDTLLRRTAGPLPVPLAVRIARETLSALQAAHEAGLIHRDIKPPNIWLEAPSGRVKVLDFGLAKSAETVLESEAESQLTAQGAIVGTPAYMAPEQARGQTVDARADLFSLGCVLYEMLTGSRPFTGKDTLAILMSLASYTPPAPHTIRSDCPAAVSAIVMRLLEKDPAARPPSAQAVIDSLAELDGSPGDVLSAKPTDVQPDLHELAANSQFSAVLPPKTASRRRRTQILVATAFGMLGMLALVALMFGGQMYRIITNQGELVVSVADPGVEVKIVQDGVIVQDKTTNRAFTLTAGKGEIEVFEKDGVKLATQRFELTRGGKTTVKVTLPQLAEIRAPAKNEISSSRAVAKRADPMAIRHAERQAAEFILSLTVPNPSWIVINEGAGVPERRIESLDKLPAGAFTLVGFRIAEQTHLTDGDLRQFKACPNLRLVELVGLPKVTDGGLAHFKNCKSLTSLTVGQLPELTDAALAQLENLTSLSLENEPLITAPGLAASKSWPNLTSLAISHCTNITDSGLAQIPPCTKLTGLTFMSMHELSGAGLAAFGECKDLTTLTLHGLNGLTDSGLAHFRRCKKLTVLALVNCPRVSDIGLENFKDCESLTSLTLDNTRPVTDSGLAYFKNRKNLITLSLANCTAIGDEGLHNFQECAKLSTLLLNNAPLVTDAGLTFLQNRKELTSLALMVLPRVTDNGLAVFADCPDLKDLNLFGLPKITDAGLAKFAGCKHLEWISLAHSPISDETLPVLAALPKLRDLTLTDTRNSRNGFEQLKDALGDRVHSWSEPNRTVAERALALGGTVRIGAPGQPDTRVVKAAADLPGEFVQVREVSLTGITKPLGDFAEQLSLLNLKRFDRLERLDLSGTSGFDLAGLDGVQGLRELLMPNCGLTDDALSRLPRLRTLEHLVLDGNDIRGIGLAALAEQPALVDLSLGCPKLTDLSAKNLESLGHLKRLSLAGSSLTDIGLKSLAGLSNLESLDLSRTKATTTGIASLRKSLPNCRVTASID